jgi:hypothetical protein
VPGSPHAALVHAVEGLFADLPSQSSESMPACLR